MWIAAGTALVVAILIVLLIVVARWVWRSSGPQHIRLARLDGIRGGHSSSGGIRPKDSILKSPTAEAEGTGQIVGPEWQVTWDPISNVLEGADLTYYYHVAETEQSGSTTMASFVLNPLTYDNAFAVSVYATVNGARSDTSSAILGPILAPPQISSPVPYAWDTSGFGFVQFSLDPPTSQPPDLTQFSSDAQAGKISAVISGTTGSGLQLSFTGNLIVSAGNTWHVNVTFNQTIPAGDTVNIQQFYLSWPPWGSGNSLTFSFVMPPGSPQHLSTSPNPK